MLESENPIGVAPASILPGTPETLQDAYWRVRRVSLDLISDLAPEDTVPQSMPETSPVKWHLAHTTWFFEQFLLSRASDYRPFNAEWMFLFNSYYQSVGPMHARPQRGLLTRPTLNEVLDYRSVVDERMSRLLEQSGDHDSLAVLGLNHEQQHQELLLTDIKHLFSVNPLLPIFRACRQPVASTSLPLEFIPGSEGIVDIGHAGPGFAFDCETPRHRELLHPHALAKRLVSNAEFAEFIRDGGYRTPVLWMSEGWNAVREREWTRPLYWAEDLAREFSLAGMVEIDANAPVSHVSFYEADAFARWAGARLPTEAEWECAAQEAGDMKGNFLDSGLMHPQAAKPGAGIQQLFGDVWEWTASPYVNFPGYRAPEGALGEYNGKFMCGQYVLRGGSCVTPADHIRSSYRNFFAPADRWQFMGLRLGKDR